MRELLRLMFASCVMLGLASSTCHAELPLSVEVDASTPQARSDGPIPVSLRLRWHGPGVFDGALRLSLRDSVEGTLVQLETDPLYLMEEEQVYRLLFPAFHAEDSLGELELRMSCDYDGERHTLPSLLLRVPRIEQRRLAVLVVGDASLPSTNVNRVVDSLDLESFNPLSEQSQVTTITNNMAADLLAEDPLQFCTYDLVVVLSSELARIKQKQLDALRAWTLAGGSLLVLSEGPVGGPQLAFLDALVDASDQPEVSLVLNSEGHLILPDEQDVIRVRSGLGRVVIASSEITRPGELKTTEWRRTTAFLWKFQQAHVKSVAEQGEWDLDTVKQAAIEYGLDGRWGGSGNTDDSMLEVMASRLYPQTITGGSGMLEQLLPSGLRLVPISLMFLLLLLYLGAIGPFDYWFLGKLRQRKLTWVLFPVMTAAFTGLAVWTSDQYMSSNDDRNTLVIRDMDDDGRPLRENRIELLFPGRSTTMRSDYQRSLFMPLNHGSYMMASNWQYNPATQSYEPEQQGMSGAPAILGRMPSRFEVRQQIAQWTPQLNRSLSIPLPEEQSPDQKAEAQSFNWRTNINWSDQKQIDQLTQRIRTSFGSQASAYLYHQKERRVLIGPEQFFQDEDELQQVWMAAGYWTQRKIDFLKELCVRSQPGWFGVVSQTSPGCGPMLEDLAILDRSDPHAWLLVIALAEGEDIVLYRKLYREEPVQ
ncbi:MAG: hypothetical protein R3C02_03455 [Planctomycetaceae bacterium]